MIRSLATCSSLLMLFVVPQLGCQSDSSALDSKGDASQGESDAPADGTTDMASGSGGTGGQIDGPVGGTGGSGLQPDAGIVDPNPSIGVGKPCMNDSGCEPGLTCLNKMVGWPTEGYCSMICATNDECGGDAFCSNMLADSGAHVCIKKCGAGNTCDMDKRLCSQKLAGAFDLGQPGCVPGNSAAKDGIACKSFGDCLGTQVCVSNVFSTPNGVCLTVGCTPGDNSTCAPGGDGVCIETATQVRICVDKCSAPTDCRQSDNYTCRNVGPSAAGLCVHDNLPPGAACTKNLDCGPEPWECLTGERFPGGYCGARGCSIGNTDADKATCPLDTHCYDPDPTRVNDQYCVTECKVDADCRNADGYTCKAITGGKGCVL